MCEPDREGCCQHCHRNMFLTGGDPCPTPKRTPKRPKAHCDPGCDLYVNCEYGHDPLRECAKNVEPDNPYEVMM